MPSPCPTVRDHLDAGPPLPEWVHLLGERIQQLEGGPAAVAASRARDLYHNRAAARGLARLLDGGEILSGLPPTSLSRLQRAVLRRVLHTLLLSLLDALEEESHER